MTRITRLSAKPLDKLSAYPVCIYCGQPAHSDEHVIPRFLGEFSGFPHLENRICSDCNNGFSRLERQLARSGPEALMRVICGIHGRPEHRPGAVFTGKSSGASPVEAVFKDPSSNTSALVQLKEGGVGELLPCVHARDNAGHEVDILFDDSIQSGEQLRDRLAKAGMLHPTGLRGIVQETDKPRLEQVLNAVFDNHADGSWQRYEMPSILPPLKLTFHPTEAYYRAITKIAFHYMLSMYPGVTGSEECFKGLRHYIRYGDTKKNPVSHRHGSLLIVPRKAGPDHWSHMFMVTNNQGRLTVSVQLFIGPAGPTAPLGRFDSMRHPFGHPAQIQQWELSAPTFHVQVIPDTIALHS
jgi:hypothetical protein